MTTRKKTAQEPLQIETAPEPETLEDIQNELNNDTSDVEFEEEEQKAEVLDAPDLTGVFAGFFGMLGKVVCVRFGVDDLTMQEAAMLGKAASDVAAQYDMQMDAKTAAWIAFASAASMVVIPRIEQLPAREAVANDPEPVTDAAA